MPNNQKIIEQTRAFMQDRFATETTGHDYWHMYRVWQTAKHIATKEKDTDTFIVELAALLHDIDDWKFNDGSSVAGAKAAREWLTGLKVNEDAIAHVEAIILNVSYKGNFESKLSTIEGKIVHDADKLDSIGAIGIARAFTSGAHYQEIIHDPSVAVPTHTTVEEYVKVRGAQGRTVINHFYEKLLLLKGRMLTKTGQQMAIHRHKVMEQFLEEFYMEWDGKA